MFGKHKQLSAKQVAEQPARPVMNVQVIPKDFYGGADPVIYRTTPAVEREEVVLETTPVVAPVPTQPPKAPAHISRVKQFLVVGLVLVVAGVGAITWNEYRKYTSAKQASTDQPTPVAVVTTTSGDVPEINVSPVVSSTITPSTSEVFVPSTTPSLEDTGLRFPPIQIVNATDLDADELTDLEEEYFDTDSGKWDSDGDGYYDGQEVKNLYNPRGIAPKKIIDSGLVREYVSPVWKYRLYVPLGWETAAVDPRGDQVLLSSITGDYISVYAIPRLPAESFESWFGRVAVGQLYSDVRPQTNRFQESYLRRTDGLVAYVTTDQVVFVLTYHSQTPNQISYRQIMDVVIQSFRPTKTTIEIPEQRELPRELLPVVSSSTNF